MLKQYTEEQLETLDIATFLKDALKCFSDKYVKEGGWSRPLWEQQQSALEMTRLFKCVALGNPPAITKIVEKLRALDVAAKAEEPSTAGLKELQTELKKVVWEELGVEFQDMPDRDKKYFLIPIFDVLLLDPAVAIVVLNNELIARNSLTAPLDVIMSAFLINMLAEKEDVANVKAAEDVANVKAAIIPILEHIVSGEAKTLKARTTESKSAVKQIQRLLDKIRKKIPSDISARPDIVRFKEELPKIAQALVKHAESKAKPLPEASKGPEVGLFGKIGNAIRSFFRWVAGLFGRKPKEKRAEASANTAMPAAGADAKTSGHTSAPKMVLHQVPGATGRPAAAAPADTPPADTSKARSSVVQ
ncbi:MAG: hypothetical protein V4490_07750 [Pseudomonadota bacterium]